MQKIKKGGGKRLLRLVLSSGCFWLGAACLMLADEPPAGLLSLEVPDDFVVEQVAAPPLVKFPMLGTFDDRGRLFVCASAGLNLDAEQLLDQLPNFVQRLEDTDGDGDFDKSTVFADKMTLPSGAMWHDGALYVASPPSIWRLADTDGDGVADQRDELVTGFKFRGHAGDVHGPYLGPDGRLYFVDGIMGHEIYDAHGQLLSQGDAARVFSSRRDGSDLQTFCGGGMANPTAVTFTEAGEMLGVTTFFHYNAKDRIRHDGFFHAVYGGVYPRKVGYLRNEFKLTGSLLPPLARFGMSAPAHLTTYRSGAFGDDYRGNIFISHFNRRSVMRSRLTRDGSTFRTTNEPFLTSKNPDFHPCAVIEDADGSLLVMDTGGWFKIGCPTSSLQPQVSGGIYRVRRKQQFAMADPRGAQIGWDDESSRLLTLLADERFVVRDRAITALVKRGDLVVDLLRQGLQAERPLLRRNAVWVLTRIGTRRACGVARLALRDTDPTVRQAAAVCAATHQDIDAGESLLALLDDVNLEVARQAATALGRIGQSQAVPRLLRMFEQAPDRMLEHAVIYALIEINAPEATAFGLESSSPPVQRATLIALDQMENPTLTAEMVAPLFSTEHVGLLEAAVDVVSRHPNWTEMVVGVLKRWLTAAERTEERQERLRDVVYALRHEETCQMLIADILAGAEASIQTRLLLLDVMIDSGFAEFPLPWQRQLFAHLNSPDARVAQKSLVAMASTTSGQFDEGLLQSIEEVALPVALRVRAAEILSRQSKDISETTFALLCSQCSQDTAFDTRLEAARAIGNLKLTSQQVNRVIDLVAQAGPLELPLLLQPLTGLWRTLSKTSSRRLLAALEKAPGFASLQETVLTNLFQEAPAEIRVAAQPLLQRLQEEYASSIREVLRTTFNLVGGDPSRGKEIFFGKRALCSACHRVGPQKGKEIGPDLRRIGEVRSPRDLLEAILAPSASLARGFEGQTVVTTSGRVISGVLHQETDDFIVLFTSQREEVRIPRSDVEEINASAVSIMPAGLERLLTSDELRDLLAYLGSLQIR